MNQSREPPATVDVFEYRPKQYVRRGEKLRVRGGPIYKDHDGVEHVMGERGTFTFCGAFEERRGRMFLMLHGENGIAVIPVKPRRTKHSLPGYKAKPYSFVKVRASTHDKPKRRKVKAVDK